MKPVILDTSVRPNAKLSEGVLLSAISHDHAWKSPASLRFAIAPADRTPRNYARLSAPRVMPAGRLSKVGADSRPSFAPAKRLSWNHAVSAADLRARQAD